MRRFSPCLRYRLRTLLLLPVLFGAGWFWITWPDRTLDRLLIALDNGDMETAKLMIDSTDYRLSFDDGLRLRHAKDKTLGPGRRWSTSERGKFVRLRPNFADILKAQRICFHPGVKLFLQPRGRLGRALALVATRGHVDIVIREIPLERLETAKPMAR